MSTILSFNNGEIEDKFVSGFDATMQMIENKLYMIKGTWAFNTTEGLDTPNNFYKPEDEIIAEVVSIILTVDGVSKEDGSIQLTNKIKQKDGKLTLEFTIKTIYNKNINISI